MRNVWASDDEECPKAKQMRYLKQLKGLDKDLDYTFDGIHNDILGMNDEDFMAGVLSLMEDTGKMMSEKTCNNRFRLR